MPDKGALTERRALCSARRVRRYTQHRRPRLQSRRQSCLKIMSPAWSPIDRRCRKRVSQPFNI